MSDPDLLEVGQGWADADQPFDDLENLYIATIRDADGEIITRATPDDPNSEQRVAARIFGEVLIYARREGDAFVVERVRRVALIAVPVGDESNLKTIADLGLVSLVGPLEGAPIDPDQTGGVIIPLVTLLHYAALSSQLAPRLQDSHVEVPQQEIIAGKMDLRPGDLPRARGAPRQVWIDLDQPAERPPLGLVRRVAIRPTVLDFVPAGTPAEPQARLLALPTGCQAPTGPCPPNMGTLRRTLSLRFMDFTSGHSTAAVEQACQTQILAACPLWRTRGALELIVDPVVEPGSSDQRTIFHDFGGNHPNTIYKPLPTPGNHALPNQAMPFQAEVYIVNTMLDPTTGGGAAFIVSTAMAFCVLAMDMMQVNPNLLAHELGHLFGLAHPDGSNGVYLSSLGSVMQAGTPNPGENTAYNCRIFTNQGGGVPYSPLIVSTTIADCFRPSPVDAFVGDFPADTGLEPSLAPGNDWWSRSDVWNRRTNSPGAASPTNGPQHENPHNTDTSNFMHVTLKQRTNASDPVEVRLFLSEPGAPGGAMALRPLATSNTLSFPALPNGGAVTMSIPWSPSALPPGFPSHSCVLALASSLDEPGPSVITHSWLASRLAADNDVAQRNLDILLVSPKKFKGLRSFTSWVQIANPFAEAAPAALTIDTTEALALVDLALEVDGDGWLEPLGTPERVELLLREALEPGESIVLRLAARVSPDAPIGLDQPIRLQFAVGKQSIGGYQHVLCVAELGAIVEQTLDRIVGMLRDLAFGFDLDDARQLALSMTRALKRHRGRPERGLQALRRHAARLTNYAEQVSSSPEPEAQLVRRGLNELAGLLLAIGNERESGALAEHIRELTDRIQEPAGRVARRRLRLQEGQTEASPATLKRRFPVMSRG